MTATPNHALQRTGSAVTPPAADHRHLSTHRQVPRPLRPSLSLGALGVTTRPPMNEPPATNTNAHTRTRLLFSLAIGFAVAGSSLFVATSARRRVESTANRGWGYLGAVEMRFEGARISMSHIVTLRWSIQFPAETGGARPDTALWHLLPFGGNESYGIEFCNYHL